MYVYACAHTFMIHCKEYQPTTHTGSVGGGLSGFSHLSGGEKSGGELAGGELVVNCLVATCPTPKANQLPWPREWMLGECVKDAPSSI